MAEPQKKLIQCYVLRGNKQAPEILVSLERMKALCIIHKTFGNQTINEYLFNNGPSLNKYSERYMCNNIKYYKPAKDSLREPTKEEKSLREKMICKYPESFVEKLGPNDRVICKPIKLEVNKRKAEQMRPTNHIKPFDVTYHLRESFQREICDMLEAGIIERCEVSTQWNIKAFPVAKQDGTSCRAVGDWHGVNSILKKLLHHTESCDQTSLSGMFLQPARYLP